MIKLMCGRRWHAIIYVCVCVCYRIPVAVQNTQADCEAGVYISFANLPV